MLPKYFPGLENYSDVNNPKEFNIWKKNKELKRVWTKLYCTTMSGQPHGSLLMTQGHYNDIFFKKGHHFV